MSIIIYYLRIRSGPLVIRYILFMQRLLNEFDKFKNRIVNKNWTRNQFQSHENVKKIE